MGTISVLVHSKPESQSGGPAVFFSTDLQNVKEQFGKFGFSAQ